MSNAGAADRMGEAGVGGVDHVDGVAGVVGAAGARSAGDAAGEAGGTGVRTVRFLVPGLIDRPAVGTSCCAATAEAIVAQELSMLPGIADLTIDLVRGSVTVVYAPGAVDQDEIGRALEEIDYPASAAVVL